MPTVFLNISILQDWTCLLYTSFVDIKQPEIVFHADEVFDAEVSGENPEEALESERKSELGDANAENEAEKIVLSVEDYNVTFDREIMEHVSFVLHAGDKVAIVGPNGTCLLYTSCNE